MPAARPNPGEARFLQKQFLTERSYPEPSQTASGNENFSLEKIPIVD